jgi:hypothetical protein
VYTTIKANTHEILRRDTVTTWYFNNLMNVPEMTDSLSEITAYNPKYRRLFLPLTLYHAPFDTYRTLDWQMPYDSDNDYSDRGEIDRNFLNSDSLWVDADANTNKMVNGMLFNVYMKDYNMVQHTEDWIMSRKSFDERIASAPTKTKFANLFRSDPPRDESIGRTSLMSYKPNWWTYGGSISVQMTQNYISGNWYKGGESINNLLGYVAFKANYNDKEKIQWDNLLEIKYGISSAPSDTCHKFLVSNDLFRVYSKMGIQTSHHWYYTLTGEFNTQLSNSYKKNTNDVLTSFLSPANLIFSIGMDYKVKNKKIDFSLLLSPLAYNLRYVGDRRVDETAYGLKEGDKILHLYGSKLTSTWTWKMMSSVSWTSRLYYFTDYKSAEAEWENTFNFILNKYLSAQLFLHGRFDDKVTPKSGYSYFQLKEYLSFGINYAW